MLCYEGPLADCPQLTPQTPHTQTHAMMKTFPVRLLPTRRVSLVVLSLALLAGVAAGADAKPVAARRPMIRPKIGPTLKLPAVFKKSDPESTGDLIGMEHHVAKFVKTIMKATVGVRIRQAQGSGVIVSPDGFVLTAAHVSGAAGRPVTLIFPDGKTAHGVSLGANVSIDAGLIKITDKGRWPFLNIGRMEEVKTGDWCIAIGHPGGFKPGRPPVVRLGRIIVRNSNFIQTDATLVGGDSGGPLFDMHGRVIGINSRIGMRSTQNIHVPISAFDEDWGRLATSNVWGSRIGRNSGTRLGIDGEDHPRGCRITGTPRGLPAARAGLQVGDVVTKFDGKPVKSMAGLARLVSRKRAGDKVVVEVLRKGKTLKMTVTLDRH
jgi:serine protease Do